MKALFAHGLKFYEDSRGKLFTRGYGKEYWNRYLEHFDELYVLGRKIAIDIDEISSSYNEFEGSKLHFIEVPEIHNPVNYYYNIKKCNKIIDNIVQSVDYVISRLPGTYSSKAIKQSLRHNKPYLIELVGCSWDALWHHSLKGKLIAPIMYLSTKKVVKRAPYVIYVSSEFLQHRYPSKGKTIGCSDVSLPSLNEGILMQRLDKINNIDAVKPIIVGTIGAVNVRYKGQQYVIEAISRLNQQGYNYEYHLVGGGDHSYLRATAEKFNVAEKVKFIGSLSHERVFNFLDNVDLYVQPSKTEGLPRALVEAMSRGCPSVGSRIGGIPELLNSELTFKAGSVEEICKLLRMLDKKTMIQKAKLSFESAKKFEINLLNKKRDIFFKEFVVNNKKG